MSLTRSLRRQWWWLVSFLTKHRKLIVGAGGISILVFIFLKNLLPLLPQFKPKQRIGIVGQYTLNTLPRFLAPKLSRGLFKYTQSGAIEPDLALNWKISEDGTTYTVALRQDQFWSDGTQTLAEDFVYDLPDINISYPNSSTIEFKLSQPYSPFLTLLTRPVFKDKTIGSDDVTVKSLEWQGQFLKRLRLISKSEELDYRFYSSHQGAWLGFRLGEVDTLENLMINPLDGRWKNRVKLESRLNRQSYLAILFNLADKNLANKSLRQALAYATDHKSPDEASRALSPISPDSWAFNPGVKPYLYNPGQAKDLFDKFKEEADFKDQMVLNFGTSVSFLKQAEIIAADWEKTLGIKINVKTVNSLESDWQAILVVQEIPLDPDQHAFWHSTQSTNLTHYSDLKVDKLLEDGRQIADQNQRKEIYQDFQRFLVEDSPAIFLSNPMIYTISRN